MKSLQLLVQLHQEDIVLYKTKLHYGYDMKIKIYGHIAILAYCSGQLCYQNCLLVLLDYASVLTEIKLAHVQFMCNLSTIHMHAPFLPGLHKSHNIGSQAPPLSHVY